ncbi:MAG: hypothetical protein ACE37F_37030 [Nannocystaceae bacterium]|nr:hypothetical protein [bacterium]
MATTPGESSTGGDSEGSGDGTAGAEGTSGGESSAASAADSSGAAETDTEGPSVGPTIESFTVDGDTRPDLSVSGGFELRVVASDDDEVAGATFYRDGELLGEGTALGGGAFSLEWILAGAVENGGTVLEVVVSDSDGNEASEEIITQVDLPNGGVVEGWEFDGGDNSSVWGISPNEDGDEVLWVGNFWNGSESLARIDRIEGPAWEDVTATDSEFAIDSTTLDNGEVLAAISFGTALPRSTAVRRYSPSGSELATEVIGGGPDPDADNYPLGLERDRDENIYVLGSYAGDAISSFLTKLEPDLDLVWTRDITGSAETDGEPFVYDFDVDDDGNVAVVGSRVAGARKLWLATYSPDGALVEQLTLTDEFPRSEGHDVTWTSDGDLVVTGATAATTEGPEDWRWIVRKYDAGLNPLWTEEGPNNTGFGQAIAADPFGNVVSVVLDTCDWVAPAFAYDGCRLVIRKRDADGNLVWQYQGANAAGDFAGPALFFAGFKADVETDRFGFSYVTSIYRPSNGDNGVWWATKHNP